MTDIESPDAIYGQAAIDDSTTQAPFYGASTFMRRPYQRELEGVDIAVLGVPFDLAVCNRPGTGTPVAGGLNSNQALEILRNLGGIDFVGMDLVEVAPDYDHAEITALIAAQLALEYLCLRAANRPDGE